MDILLIEDNRADARLFEILLNQVELEESCKLKWVNCLKGGLDHLASSEAKACGAVFTDLGLPDSFGRETLESVREASGGIPVFVLTGDDDEQKAREMVDCGAADCLSKNTISTEHLEKVLSEIERSSP